MGKRTRNMGNCLSISLPAWLGHIFFKAIWGVMVLGSVQASLASNTFYAWRTNWLSGASVGSDLSFTGDVDHDGIQNGVEYAVLSDPLSESAVPVSLEALSSTNVVLEFPWNRNAEDINWEVYASDSLTLSNALWPPVCSADLSRSEEGDLSRIRMAMEAAGVTNRFYALRIQKSEAGTVSGRLDDDGRVEIYGNTRFKTSVLDVVPTSGFEFLSHSVGTAWSHSGAVCPFSGTIEPGKYIITIDLGHDGSDRPFATGYVSVGFLEDGAGLSRGSDVRDAIRSFDALTGVTRTVVDNEVPNAGWKTWRIEIDVDGQSSAIGKAVDLGIHVQSGSTGNQALFDNLHVEKQAAEDEGWVLYNQAKSVDEAGWLTPVHGSRFLYHSVSTPWSKSAMVKQSVFSLTSGVYTVMLNAGCDANLNRPFAADDCVSLGLFDSGTTIGEALDVKNALASFADLPGITVSEVRGAVANGWTKWTAEIAVAPDSSALGMPVYFAVFAQSKVDANQVAFDNVQILPPADEEVWVDAGTEVALVNKNMFGVNLVYHTEDLDSNFIRAFNESGLEVLRYPGGTICEQEFDYLDSDGPDDDRPSLSDVISFCNSNNTELVLVVPVKRFKDDIPAGVQYAKDFVTAVNIDKDFGDIHVTYWELGNEYYADGNNGAEKITVGEYKQLADQMAAGMVDADPTIKPVVQFSRHRLNEAQEIGDYLVASTNNGAVRASLTHVYPWEEFLPIRDEVPGELSSGKGIFGFDDLLITEWNIGTGADLSGMKLANYFLLLFDSLVKGGATLSTVWPMSWQYNGVKTALSDIDTGELRPPGQVFSALSHKVKSTAMVKTTIDGDTYYVSAYRSGSQELVLFLMCYELPASTSVKIRVDGFAFDRVEAERLGEADELAHGAATWSEAHVVQNGSDLYIEANKLNDWEIIRLVLYPE